MLKSLHSAEQHIGDASQQVVFVDNAGRLWALQNTWTNDTMIGKAGSKNHWNNIGTYLICEYLSNIHLPSENA